MSEDSYHYLADKLLSFYRERADARGEVHMTPEEIAIQLRTSTRGILRREKTLRERGDIRARVTDNARDRKCSWVILEVPQKPVELVWPTPVSVFSESYSPVPADEESKQLLAHYRKHADEQGVMRQTMRESSAYLNVSVAWVRRVEEYLRKQGFVSERQAWGSWGSYVVVLRG